jgi:1-acyl-sn-glycerol-3-phosphate acyltransferase
MKESLKTLRDGAVLVVFPEGAREFADGEFLEFKTGAVKIAAQAKVPVLPVTISGGNRIWPQKQKYPALFRRVTIKYHPLVDLGAARSALTDAEVEQWTEKLREMIGHNTAKAIPSASAE